MAGDQKKIKIHLSHRLLLLIGVALVAGALGGLTTLFSLRDYFSTNQSRSQQVVLQESSAIIEVADRVGRSVVNIVSQEASRDAFGRRQIVTGAGSGIIISSNGLVLTNKHVVQGADRVDVTLNDHRQFKNVKVIARDPLNDLAYLKIDAKDLPAAELGDSDQTVVGQRVVAIGNALGAYPNTVTSGIISGSGRPVRAGDGFSESEVLEDLIQTDAAINPGNSGGPLVNIEGQVIGINTAVAQAENIGFTIPINQAKGGIASIEKTGELRKPFLGVRFISLNPDIAKQEHLKVDYGAWLNTDRQPAVVPDSPAEKAGLKEGDIIIALNGDAINQGRSLGTLISRHQPGDKITLDVKRGDQDLKIEATLSTLPNN